jgi:hypothetical protein
MTPNIGRSLAVTNRPNPQFKVFGAVVVANAIDVVNGLTRTQSAP